MSQQHQKWSALVRERLTEEGMTQTHLAKACGVSKSYISEMLKYGKGGHKLKNKVSDILHIDESWTSLEE